MPRVTYMEGYLYDRPEAKDAFRRACDVARAANRLTSVTLSDSFCVERHRDDFLHLIRSRIDIVFANETEIKSLYQTQNFNGAMEAIRKDCAIAVLTRSEKGSVIVRGKETVEVPAHRVSQVVDVTGAGDLYAAGFLFGFTRELPLARCAATRRPRRCRSDFPCGRKARSESEGTRRKGGAGLVSRRFVTPWEVAFRWMRSFFTRRGSVSMISNSRPDSCLIISPLIGTRPAISKMSPPSVSASSSSSAGRRSTLNI